MGLYRLNYDLVEQLNYEDHNLYGIVARLDPREGRACLRTDSGMEWVLWRDIVSAEFAAGYTSD